MEELEITRWSQSVNKRKIVHTAHRNIAVRDIVLLCDQTALRGQFRLGKVVSTTPDSKGTVRDVNVQVFPNYCAPVAGTQKKSAHPAHGEKLNLTLLAVEKQMETQARLEQHGELLKSDES